MALHQLPGLGTRFSDLCRNPPSKAIFSKRREPPGRQPTRGSLPPLLPLCPLGGAQASATQCVIRLMS